MTTKAEFDAVQWQTVTEGPALAGLIVVAAQRGGTLRETMQIAKAYTEARAADEGLMAEIVGRPPSVEPGQFPNGEQLQVEGLARIRDAVSLLSEKADAAELEQYRRFCLEVAERAAEAAKSGGVLGIGGERVSDAERRALDQVRDALGAEPGASVESLGESG